MSAPTFDYHPRQAFVGMHNRTQRWSVVVAHRRAGKTVALLNDIIVRALHPSQHKMAAQYAYMTPYQNQARAVAWEYLKSFTAPFSDRKSTRLNSSHITISYAVFC